MRDNKGFTLIEMLIVTLMIGILSAIAVPSWAAFVNRQRVNAANDAVLRALRQAQSEAKRTKQSYSASFKIDNSVPKFAVHLATVTTPTNWESLNSELRPGQITLGTNLSSENTAGSSITYGSVTAQRITFDFRGILPTDVNLNTRGLIVTVAASQSGSPALAIDTSRRCVRVLTLLGGMKTGKENECNAL